MIAQARQIKQVTHEVPAPTRPVSPSRWRSRPAAHPGTAGPGGRPATTRRRTDNGHGHRRTARG
ncbi:hypothetical protein ACR6C2_22200 [Streptomyces sp. INA 01156]